MISDLLLLCHSCFHTLVGVPYCPAIIASSPLSPCSLFFVFCSNLINQVIYSDMDSKHHPFKIPVPLLVPYSCSNICSCSIPDSCPVLGDIFQNPIPVSSSHPSQPWSPESILELGSVSWIFPWIRPGLLIKSSPCYSQIPVFSSRFPFEITFSIYVPVMFLILVTVLVLDLNSRSIMHYMFLIMFKLCSCPEGVIGLFFFQLPVLGSGPYIWSSMSVPIQDSRVRFSLISRLQF